MSKEQYIVPDTEQGERLDKVMLANMTGDISRQQIQQWIKAAFITVNDMKQKPNYRVKLGDCIHWAIPEVEPVIIAPEDIPLAIVFEDEDLIVLNKPKGMLVHPTPSITSGTLVNALMHYTETLSTLGGTDRPGIVHRLDQDTSGLLLIAKNDAAHEKLKAQFQARTVERIYEAVVYGVVQNDRGIIQAPIGRHPKRRLEMTVTPDGKEAETHFTVLDRFEAYTHVQCQLITGRTHQIRVHMKYMNHPIVGDPVYVRKKANIANGQMLFAKQLGFHHPSTKEYMTFSIDRPIYFQKILDKFQGNA